MYKLEIFTDQMDFADAALIQEQTVELDYLTFDAFTLEATPVCCRKGYFVHVTRGVRWYVTAWCRTCSLVTGR